MLCSVLPELFGKTKTSSEEDALQTNSREGYIMDDLRDSRTMKEKGVLGDFRGIKINRKEEVSGDLSEPREGDESYLNARNINDRKWHLVELEDGDVVVTTLSGECLEANKNGEVNESECILNNDSQLWQMNGETLMNKATGRCLTGSRDESNFKTVGCD